MRRQAQDDFQRINEVLMGVIKVAVAYLMHHDDGFKPYCLQNAAWDGIEKLKEIAATLSELFRDPVSVCLAQCAAARERMPTVNIGCTEEFPVAAASLTAVAQHLDLLRESDPSLMEGIDEDDLAPGQMFTKLAQMAAQM